MDELYEAAKAFVFNDPDGNGKDDTIGIGLNEYSWINVFNLFNRTEVNNSTGKWVIQEDGSLLYYIFTEESRQALQWLQTAYKEGVLYKDFVSAKSQQVIDLMKGGSLGMYGEGLSNSWVVDETLRKIVPEAETLPIVSLAGPSGVQHTGEGTGVFGMFAVPKTVPQDKLEKIIDFFVYGATDEGYMLGNYGVEGLHYNLVDGEPVVTEQAAKDVVTGMNNIFAQYDKYYYAKAPNIPKDYLERNRSIIDAKEKVAVPSVSYGLYSPTFVEFGGDMEKNINDFIIKTIIGENSLEDWDGFVQEMTGNKSLTAITQEMNEAYQVRLK